jgi:hypothetical protein
VGETITYSYVVTNTGNVTVAAVSVTDPTLGHVTCPAPAAPGLAPGDSLTCTADKTYTVTQSDVDDGSVSDTATAAGTDTHGKPSPPSDPSTVTVPSKPSPQVELVKTAAVAPSADQAGVKVGDKITYSYKVTNVGNVDLATLAVSDPTGGKVSCPVPAAPGLAPGDSETCTADDTYTVTQADVDAGAVTDTATATGTDGSGRTSPKSDPSTVIVPAAAQLAAVKIVKHAQVTPSADANAVQAGDKIAYSYTVTNSGNVTLKSVSVSDPTLGKVICPVPPAPGLAPGDSETCTANDPHTVDDTDVQNGQVTDTATATGTGPKDRVSPPSDPSTVVVPSTHPKPVVTLSKTPTVSPTTDQNHVKVGDTIRYTFTVTNIGGTDLTKIAVSDPTLGAVECPTPAAPGLAPGQSEKCTSSATHTVTQADLNGGHVDNTATASGTDPAGQSSPNASASASVPTAGSHHHSGGGSGGSPGGGGGSGGNSGSLGGQSTGAPRAGGSHHHESGESTSAPTGEVGTTSDETGGGSLPFTGYDIAAVLLGGMLLLGSGLLVRKRLSKRRQIE